MTEKRPIWIEKFDSTNVGDEWCDEILSEYPNSLVRNLPNSISPENFVIVNPLDIQNHKEVSHMIDIPRHHTVTYVLMFLIDMLEDFAEALPRKDHQIYQLYKQMDELDGFYTNYDFEDFYVFCRRIQYVDMNQLKLYKFLSDLEETNTVPDDIYVGSVTEVEYNGQPIDIEVEEFRDTESLLIGSSVIVSVIDDSVDKEKITLPPSSFTEDTK